MIWRLTHPARGVLAFLLVWAGGVALLRFGAGIPEMIVLTGLALVTFVVAGRGSDSERADSST